MMSDQELLDRITISPKVMVGKPCVRGTRLTVDYVLNRLAHGTSVDEFLQEDARLKPEDIRACFLFASKTVDGDSFAGPN
jgi:uncharacterized protein (DUF433 family)